MIFIVIIILIILGLVFSLFFDIAVIIELLLSLIPDFGFLKKKLSHKSENNRSQSDDFNEKIKTLVRQSARWTIASEQDENPYIAMLHANYGAGYIFALRSIATDAQIKNATGLDVIKLEREITKVQDMSFVKLARVCPEGQPKSEFLRLISGQGVKNL